MAPTPTTPLPALLAPKQLRQFVSKIRVSDSCWFWTGSYTRGGYGSFGTDGKTFRAARLSYRIFRGPFDESLHIDHLCHTMSDCQEGEDCPHRACVNPLHLQPITTDMNHHRKRFRLRECPNGHLMDVDNIHIPKETPVCRTCAGDSANASYHRLKGERAEG